MGGLQSCLGVEYLEFRGFWRLQGLVKELGRGGCIC